MAIKSKKRDAERPKSQEADRQAHREFQPLVPLSDAVIKDTVSKALAEDIGRGDVTSNSIVPASMAAYGCFYAKEAFVLAGIDVAGAAFRALDEQIVFHSDANDGDWVKRGTQFGFVRGRARALLSAERVSLNFLQRMSGIATLTNKVVQQVKETNVKILDTRKTTPLLRAFEKYAVRVGGGFNHRSGLDDGLLIKDNHVRIAGGIKPAIQRARNGSTHLLRIEVEVKNLQEMEEALTEKADVILLDNMGVAQIEQAVRMTQGSARLEISGGITLENVKDYARTGVDFISIGALTHSFKSIDISFEIL